MSGPPFRGVQVLTISLIVAACAGTSPTGSPPTPSPTRAAPTSATQSPGSSPPLAVPSTSNSPSPNPTVAYASNHATPVAAVGAVLDGAGPLAFDGAGNLYVAECDWTHAAVHRIDSTGMMTTYVGTGIPGFDGDASGPAASARLFCVADVKFGPDGALYVVDHVNNRIRRVDATDTMTTYAGSGKAGLNLGSFSGDGGLATKATLQEPWAIAFDADGNLYISDRDNNRIRKVDGEGVMTTIAGNGEVGYEGDGMLGSQTGLQLPLGIAVDGQGNVIFASTEDQRVRKVDRGTGIITTVAGTGDRQSTGDGGLATKASVADPQYVLFDAAGNLYIEETAPLAFRRIDKNGLITTVTKIGSVPITPAQVPTLNGWVFDAAGNLYVSTGTAILEFDTNGQTTVIAGVP